MWHLAAGCSIPAPSAVEASAAEYEQDDEDDQKRVGIHGGLLGEIGPLTWRGSNVLRGEIQLFLPVTSSHFSPRSFLMASTFFDASSFIATKAARAAA
jgi:hypothetical protein